MRTGAPEEMRVEGEGESEGILSLLTSSWTSSLVTRGVSNGRSNVSIKLARGLNSSPIG